MIQHPFFNYCTWKSTQLFGIGNIQKKSSYIKIILRIMTIIWSIELYIKKIEHIMLKIDIVPIRNKRHSTKSSSRSAINMVDTLTQSNGVWIPTFFPTYKKYEWQYCTAASVRFFLFTTVIFLYIFFNNINIFFTRTVRTTEPGARGSPAVQNHVLLWPKPQDRLHVFCCIFHRRRSSGCSWRPLWSLG